MPKHRITKDLSRRMDSIGKSMLEIAKHPDARLTEKQIAMLQQSILDIDSARAAIRNLLAEYHADPEAAHGPSRTKYRGKPQGISTGELIADLMELGIVKYRRDYYRKLARSAFPDPAKDMAAFAQAIADIVREKNIPQDRWHSSRLYKMMINRVERVKHCLAKEWRDFAKTHGYHPSLLLNVASHEQELQRMVADECVIESMGKDQKYDNMDEDRKYDWNEFKYVFAGHLFALKEGGFDTAPCANCRFNTANHQALFPWLDDKSPKCQNEGCYIQKANAVVDALIERLRKAGTPAIEVADSWKVPEHKDASESYNKNHPQAYVYQVGELKKVIWSVKLEKKQAERAQFL